MSRKRVKRRTPQPATRREFTDEFKREAVEMLLDGVSLLPYLAGGKAESAHESLFWRFARAIGSCLKSTDVRRHSTTWLLISVSRRTWPMRTPPRSTRSRKRSPPGTPNSSNRAGVAKRATAAPIPAGPRAALALPRATTTNRVAVIRAIQRALNLALSPVHDRNLLWYAEPRVGRPLGHFHSRACGTTEHAAGCARQFGYRD